MGSTVPLDVLGVTDVGKKAKAFSGDDDFHARAAYRKSKNDFAKKKSFGRQGRQSGKV